MLVINVSTILWILTLDIASLFLVKLTKFSYIELKVNRLSLEFKEL